jgi:hypothetical protein
MPSLLGLDDDTQSSNLLGIPGVDKPQITQPDPDRPDQGAGLADLYQRVSDEMARQQQISADRGLWANGAPTQAGLLDAARQYGNAVMMGTVAPGRLSGAAESTPGYVYHATNADRLQDIADSGKLLTHKPGDFTDQDAWPDGSTQKRNYFTPSAANTWQFAPEEGAGALLRMKQDAHPIHRERGTGDLYSTKPVPSSQLEYQGADGGWHPVDALKQGNGT